MLVEREVSSTLATVAILMIRKKKQKWFLRSLEASIKVMRIFIIGTSATVGCIYCDLIWFTRTGFLPIPPRYYDHRHLGLHPEP